MLDGGGEVAMCLLLFSFPIRQSAGALDAMGLDNARVRGAFVMRCPDSEYMQSLTHLHALVFFYSTGRGMIKIHVDVVGRYMYMYLIGSQIQSDLITHRDKIR